MVTEEVRTKKAMKIAEEVGAIITNDHIVYTSGKHGPAYVNKDAIYPHIEKSDQIAEWIASEFYLMGIEVVIGPAVGGALLARDVARKLSLLENKPILAAYADKTDGGFEIKRGYEKLTKQKNILVIEDVLTTGESLKKTIDAVNAVGGNIVGVAALCNRGGITSEDIGNPKKFFTLLTIPLEAYEEQSCPLCKLKLPINQSVGKGKEYLTKKGLI